MNSNWNTKKEFSADEIRLACEGAKENWNNLSDKQISMLDNISDMADDIAEENGGTLVLEKGTIWDYLSDRIHA